MQFACFVHGAPGMLPPMQNVLGLPCGLRFSRNVSSLRSLLSIDRRASPLRSRSLMNEMKRPFGEMSGLRPKVRKSTSAPPPPVSQTPSTLGKPAGAGWQRNSTNVVSSPPRRSSTWSPVPAGRSTVWNGPVCEPHQLSVASTTASGASLARPTPLPSMLFSMTRTPPLPGFMIRPSVALLRTLFSRNCVPLTRLARMTPAAVEFSIVFCETPSEAPRLLRRMPKPVPPPPVSALFCTVTKIAGGFSC